MSETVFSCVSVLYLSVKMEVKTWCHKVA
uniref:Uncharacterized protein n=1 Tax=Arundo donax TaxID=35708 RepID=A0A0A9B873_ARUDO